MIAVALHSVPEGMTIVFPLVMAGYSLTGYFFLAGGISLFLGAGSWLGITIGDRTFHLNTLLMGGAIGAIGYVALHEVLGKVKPKLPAVEFLFAGSAGAFFVFVFYLLAG